jgi:hypothetical protein
MKHLSRALKHLSHARPISVWFSTSPSKKIFATVVIATAAAVIMPYASHAVIMPLVLLCAFVPSVQRCVLSIVQTTHMLTRLIVIETTPMTSRTLTLQVL